MNMMTEDGRSVSQDRSISEENLERTLKDALEGYGDLVAISVVHNVSMRTLRSRLKKMQEEGAHQPDPVERSNEKVN